MLYTTVYITEYMVVCGALADGPLLACEWVGGNGAHAKLEKYSKEKSPQSFSLNVDKFNS